MKNMRVWNKLTEFFAGANDSVKKGAALVLVVTTLGASMAAEATIWGTNANNSADTTGLEEMIEVASGVNDGPDFEIVEDVIVDSDNQGSIDDQVVETKTLNARQERWMNGELTKEETVQSIACKVESILLEPYIDENGIEYNMLELAEKYVMGRNSDRSVETVSTAIPKEVLEDRINSINKLVSTIYYVNTKEWKESSERRTDVESFEDIEAAIKSNYYTAGSPGIELYAAASPDTKEKMSFTDFYEDVFYIDVLIKPTTDFITVDDKECLIKAPLVEWTPELTSEYSVASRGKFVYTTICEILSQPYYVDGEEVEPVLIRSKHEFADTPGFSISEIKERFKDALSLIEYSYSIPVYDPNALTYGGDAMLYEYYVQKCKNVIVDFLGDNYEPDNFGFPVPADKRPNATLLEIFGGEVGFPVNYLPIGFEEVASNLDSPAAQVVCGRIIREVGGNKNVSSMDLDERNLGGKSDSSEWLSASIVDSKGSVGNAMCKVM